MNSKTKVCAVRKPPILLPETISETPGSVTEEIIGCAHGGECSQMCTVAFRITPAEFQSYRRLKIPIPNLCPNCRHFERLAERTPMRLWHRHCQCPGNARINAEMTQKDAERSDPSAPPLGKGRSGGVYQNTTEHFHGAESCPNEFETSYAPDRPEIVYCESCYNAEVA
ncbi:MAG: hypothetical protein HY978_03420 [Candidatus Liptonbacteria bacterium]|nr:hypothetical protein [Candidatus Liptonbacteria bacterium]